MITDASTAASENSSAGTAMPEAHRSAAHAAVSRNANAFASRLRPIILRMQIEGHKSLWALARALNLEGIPPARAKEWHASSVRNVLYRLNALDPSRDYLAQVRTRQPQP